MAISDQYDAIVIGSGMGGLTFASLMAKLRNWRVLVLEQHFKIGGFTHTFERPGGWSWDIGVHHVGQMGEGMLARKLIDFVTSGETQWTFRPDPFEWFGYPGLSFGVPAGERAYRETLSRLFPGEEDNLDGYFQDIKSAARSFYMSGFMSSIIRKQHINGESDSRLPSMTTRAYLEARFQDARLRALVASHWGDFGLPPGQSAFAIHALIATHYLSGGWYPIGGASVIARSVAKVIRAAGGDLLPNHRVTRILIEGGSAAGVEVLVRQGHAGRIIQLRAPVVVSDAGAWNTYTKLLPREYALSAGVHPSVPPEGFEVVMLYLGLRGDPRGLGFNGENHWLFPSLDHDWNYSQRARLLSGRPAFCYLTFPSSNHPNRPPYMASIMAPFPYTLLERHRDEQWRRRSPQYEQIKRNITEHMVAFIDRYYPGFCALVEYAELATPLTFEQFSGGANGAIYGYPATPERFHKSWLRATTPVKDLYLTGVDIAAPGIMGALMGGVAAAGCVLGRLGFVSVLQAANVDLSELAFRSS